MQYVLKACLFVVLAICSVQAGPLNVRLTQGTEKIFSIAVPDFYCSDHKLSALGREMAAVVQADLKRSQLFDPIDRLAFVQDAVSLKQNGARFADWQVLNIEGLAVGEIEPGNNGKHKVKFKLFNVFGGRQTAGVEYTFEQNKWREVAHMIADVIYSRITGEKKYFNTKLAYIAETGPMRARVKRLAIMDSDGENVKYLTNGKSLVLTPRFCPTKPLIAYMSYQDGMPHVFLYNLQTGKEERLGSYPGMTFAPRFSPDGGKVLMSYSKGASSDIYVMDLKNRSSECLTSGGAIDTSPCYSPDGRKIAFNSDRQNGQQIYVMDADGRNTKRISYGLGRYATPVWSPRGDYIAFTKMYGGQFWIGVMKPDGSGERLLSVAFHNEAPTWAPNGRVILFFRQIRGVGRMPDSVQLYSVDITGKMEQKLQTPTDASHPAWSPLLR